MKNKKLKEIKYKLNDIISYQKNTISSNALINKKTGTLTLFAFDKNQFISPHKAPFDAMAYVIEGKTLIKIGNKNYNLQKGDFIIMPANIEHSLKAITKFKMLLVMIKTKI
jgi:quercetin dioxygenase-like cupin family protein